MVSLPVIERVQAFDLVEIRSDIVLRTIHTLGSSQGFTGDASLIYAYMTVNLESET